MKKDNDLLESPADEEEDLFDLSLDDLEPEDTIVEAHIEEHDDEIIELIDLVQKGDIDLGEEDKGLDGTIFTDIQESADEGTKIDETLDLLDIPLDEELSFDEFEEEIQEKTDDVSDTDHELKFFIGDEQSGAMTEEPLALFTESPIEPTPDEESLAPRVEPLEETYAIEDLLIAEITEEAAEQPPHEHEKTVTIFPEEKDAEHLFNMQLDGLEQLPGVASELIQKEQETALQQLASKSEIPTPLSSEPVNLSEEKIESIVRKIIEETMPVIVEEKINGAVEKIIAATKQEEAPPAAETATAITEEKIEAILRKVVQETVPGIAEDKISGAVEKIIEGTKREEMPAAEAPIIISEERIEEILRKLVEDVVAKVARETMAGVAERVITDAINALHKSIESASE